MKNTSSFLFLMAIITFASCKKTEGEGGQAAIRGSVQMQDWNNSFTFLEAEYPAADEEIYIIYGDDLSYGDRIRANYNGEFEFKYLRKGHYTIYVYSKDSTLKSPSGNTVVVKNVEITKNKQNNVLDQFIIFK